MSIKIPPMPTSSLYKGRIYVLTTSGQKYLYNKGSNWTDPIDTNIKDKLKEVGFSYPPGTPDSAKDYFCLDYDLAYKVGSDTVDFANIVAGNTINISSTATGTKTIILNDAVVNAKHINILADELNKLLIEQNIGIYFEFFAFSKTVLGFKVKRPYASDSGYSNTAIVDNVGNSALNGLKISGTISTGNSKLKTDYVAAVTTYITGSADMVLELALTDMENGSSKIVSINSTGIESFIVELRKIPETFKA